MSLVLDSSATLAWYFEDERTEAVTALLDRVAEEGALVPSLWRFEVANGLQMAVRRKRIDPAYCDRALSNLAALDIHVDVECDAQSWAATLKLSEVYELTVYDAAYLEAAQRRNLPLATLDAALASAAERTGVDLVLA